ncbi:MAG: DUF6249 domain-containing protein [Acidobacteriaceae bacterium]
MLLESLGESVNSPFIVPVAGCLMVLGIVAVSMWASSRKREIESQERLAAIAKGITPPPTADELALTQSRPIPSAYRRRANIRLAGIVLIGASAGIVLFFIALSAILQERDVLCGAACGLVPLGIGVGFLIDTRIQSREIDEASTTNTPHPYNT